MGKEYWKETKQIINVALTKKNESGPGTTEHTARKVGTYIVKCGAQK